MATAIIAVLATIGAIVCFFFCGFFVLAAFHEDMDM